MLALVSGRLAGSSERVERRLTAILAADVAGYSRLMGADEEGTIAQLKDHRRELVDPKIAEHRGRIVKTTGDGMLMGSTSLRAWRGLPNLEAYACHRRRYCCEACPQDLTSAFSQFDRPG
jgi:class 3 adenylate cyclase